MQNWSPYAGALLKRRADARRSIDWRHKDSMKFQIQQEKQVEQVAPTVLNQKDLDDMLDNLTIFDQ